MAASDKDLALHEAGHAAVLWLVGWEHQLKLIRLKGSGQKPPAEMVPAIQADMTSLSDLRKYLLVMWAGTAATGKNDFDKDLQDICHAVRRHLGISKVRTLFPLGFEPPEASALIFEAEKTSLRILGLNGFRSLIEEIADQLLAMPKDSSGYRTLPAADIIQLCTAKVDREAILADLASWLDGK
ncbi:hypothetical protein [Botrimarina hoheduenensis]|uniref:ATP-dependent zinc metalloprotease FtsH n=1 Tax=Botrimarina hoheduenensis TaxID=2528000 RepID=A0A5C5WFQ3_9BACT|nr:hypothetical protein [Botrimarina hoheduenensis]TWT48919.1 hypothetical protein Pla111_06970 [Botrimarina hoheduenensis]